MIIDDIQETERQFVIRLRDKMNDFEDVEVNISSMFLNLKSEHFSHGEVKLNTLRNRTIDGHIEYLKTVIQGLEQLKTKLIKGEF